MHFFQKASLFLCVFCVHGMLAATDDLIIDIQLDYWEGSKCLENGVPYQVPDSIYKESENCSKDDIVLEVGGGGSTLFLARRCKHVIAIETDRDWTDKISEQLNKSNLKNVDLYYIPNQDDIETFIRELNVENVTILSVDTSNGFNRSAFVNAFLDRGMSENFRMLVLDNYGNQDLFPLHFDKVITDSNETPGDWDVFTYDDWRWSGSGTRLYIKK